MELLNLLSAKEVIAQIVAFLILLFLLRKFLWKPFLKSLDTRKARIENEFKRIDDIKAQLSRQETEYNARLNRIEQTTKQAIQDAVIEGRRLSDDIKKQAGQEAEIIINKARDTIKTEFIAAKEALKKDVVEIAINVAEKIIEEKLTGEDDRKIVEGFLKQVEE